MDEPKKDTQGSGTDREPFGTYPGTGSMGHLIGSLVAVIASLAAHSAVTGFNKARHAVHLDHKKPS